MQRTQLDPHVHDSWKDALHESVVNSTLPAKKLAERSGSSYRHLLDCCDPASPTQISLNRLLMLLPLMENRAAIAYLAQAAGCGTYVMPAANTAGDRALGMLARETGDVFTTWAEVFADGRVTPVELEKFLKECADARGAIAQMEAIAIERAHLDAVPVMRAVGGGQR